MVVQRDLGRLTQHSGGALPWIWVCALLFIAATAGAGTSFEATVTAVPAADLLVVRAAQGERPIRLFGVDAPAVGEAYGQLAQERAAQLALGRRVKVHAFSEDPRGRLLAVVELADGRDLGRLLLADGLARWNRVAAPGAWLLGEEEAAARAAGRGQWRSPPP